MKNIVRELVPDEAWSVGQGLDDQWVGIVVRLDQDDYAVHLDDRAPAYFRSPSDAAHYAAGG